MAKQQLYQYFVEGEDEEKLVHVLKSDMGLIEAGKVQRFNVVGEKLTKLRLMSLKQDTIVILVFDTDTGNLSILNDNIKLLKKERTVKAVWCITQVKKLEDELKRSCDIRQIKELTNSKSNTDFKHDMIRDKNFDKKLARAKFDITKFWNTQDTDIYKNIVNDGNKVKIKKKR